MAETNATVTTPTGEPTNIDNNGQVQQTQQQAPEQDYKALYEQLLIDRNNLKGQVDKYSSEIKDYRKTQKEKMSDSERLQSDLEEARTQTAVLQEQIAKIKSEKVFADRGFKPEEYDTFITAMSGFGTVTEENAVNLSNAIADVIEKRVVAEKQQYENSLTATNTVQTAISTPNAKIDDFAEFRENRKQFDEQKNKKITF